MKVIKNIKTSLAVGAMIFMSACDPIEERDVLTNSYDPDNIELEVIQSSNGTGNGVTLKMNTPGVYGYWDYKLDKRFSDEVSFISPFMGNVTFTYYVTTPIISGGDPSAREYISKSIDVNIQVPDNEVNEAYYDLVGEDLDSKSWVFDKGSTNWWFMSSNGGDPWSVWWNASECCAPIDQIGKMVFDLNGAANYTYYADADDATGTPGSFSFNSDYSKLTIGGGPNILGAEGTEDVNGCAVSNNSYGVFQIVELTPDRLVLYINDAACGSGWTWVFVPEQ